LLVGILLLVGFVHNERRASEPILPMRLFAHPTRTAANVARGLVYSGMYGVFFFLTQFLQEAQGYSAVRAGIGFLPIPFTVFLSSQLTSRVLIQRFRPKTLMLSGISLTILSLATASQLHASAGYGQIVISLVLMGAGSGISLVSLTTASLEGVAPADAGAASGLVNVSQQMGAALGLSVLVTIYGAVTHHAQLISKAGVVAGNLARTHLVHGLDVTFGAGAIFALTAFVLVGVMVKTSAPALADDEIDVPEDMGDLDNVVALQHTFVEV
jgi:predicted MFS family arabinose efflux permease